MSVGYTVNVLSWCYPKLYKPLISKKHFQMIKATRQKVKNLEMAIRLMLDKSVSNVEFIQQNPNTKNSVFRTKKGILKVCMPHPNTAEKTKQSRLNDFEKGIEYLKFMSTFFPKSYTDVIDEGTIHPDKTKPYAKFLEFIPEKIRYVLIEEIHGPTLCNSGAKNLSSIEKLDILIKLGNMINLTHKFYDIINCDIKPENIIIRKGKNNYHPVLFDSESFRFRREPFKTVTYSFLLPQTAKALLDEKQGKYIDYNTHMEYLTATEQMDIHAFAVTAYEFLTGQNPHGFLSYSSDEKTLEHISHPIIIKAKQNATLSVILQDAFNQEYKTMDKLVNDLTEFKLKLENKESDRYQTIKTYHQTKRKHASSAC